MAEPVLIQSKVELPITAIEESQRLRPVSEAGVDTILASISEIGQLANAAVVRQQHRPDGIRYTLLDGAHRLEAARRLGWDAIPVRVFECNDDQARLLEIDGNLAGAELNPLDTAVFLATRKAVYERLHPETKADAFKGNRHTGSLAADTMSVASFVAVTAEKFCMSDRHVRRLVAAGTRLGPDEIARLRAAPKPVTLADLQTIAKIGAATDRYEVVDALAEGTAKNAAAALKALKSPSQPVLKDPVEEQFIALMKLWARTGGIARRRFLDEITPRENG